MSAKLGAPATPTGLGSADAPEPHTGLGPSGAIPSAAYEARVYSAHLPNRTVAFIFPESGIPFAAGMFRIEYLRPVTEADEAAFPSPNAETPDEVCPLCNRVEEFL